MVAFSTPESFMAETNSEGSTWLSLPREEYINSFHYDLADETKQPFKTAMDTPKTSAKKERDASNDSIAKWKRSPSRNVRLGI